VTSSWTQKKLSLTELSTKYTSKKSLSKNTPLRGVLFVNLIYFWYGTKVETVTKDHYLFDYY
jgi:hypothetical protein